RCARGGALRARGAAALLAPWRLTNVSHPGPELAILPAGEKHAMSSRPMFDEMNASPGEVRAHYQQYARWLAEQPDDVMALRREEAEMIFRRVGITFAVYGAKDEEGAGT